MLNFLIKKRVNKNNNAIFSFGTKKPVRNVLRLNAGLHNSNKNKK